MAITLVQHKTAFVGSTNSMNVSFSSTPTVGSVIVVCVVSSGIAGMTASDNQTPSNTYTAQIEQASTVGDTCILTAPATHSAGTFTITVHSADSPALLAAQINEYSGVNTSTPVDGTPVANNATGDNVAYATATAGTTTVCDDMCVAAIETRNTEPAFHYVAPLLDVDIDAVNTDSLFGNGSIPTRGQQVIAVAHGNNANASFQMAAILLKPAGPSISAHPTTQTVTDAGAGATASFSITASGSGGLTYQWVKNGSNVGSNSSSYSFTATQSDNLTTVKCQVTDSNGTVNSDTVLVLVTATPGIVWGTH